MPIRLGRYYAPGDAGAHLGSVVGAFDAPDHQTRKGLSRRETDKLRRDCAADVAWTVAGYSCAICGEMIGPNPYTYFCGIKFAHESCGSFNSLGEPIPR